MKGIILSLFMVVTVFVTGNASSAIYKCLDENGRPVYSATPTCVQPKEMDKISRKFQNQKKKKQIEEKAEKEQQNRKEQCEQAQVQLKRYQRAPFLTKMVKDEEGRDVKVRLNKEETEDVILDAKKEVSYWCDSKNDDK